MQEGIIKYPLSIHSRVFGMDRTAVASVIVGLGVAIAAMVFPKKYPQTPKLVINGIWWFGIISIF